jgi:hypothetical protein
MKTLVYASLFALAAAGCAGTDSDRAGAGSTSAPVTTPSAGETNPRTGDNAGAGARMGDTQARRDNRDSQPGSRENEERR